MAGHSRSVTVVAAFMMVAMGMTLLDAVQLIVAVRPSACPNSGFKALLAAIEAREVARRRCGDTAEKEMQMGGMASMARV